MKIHFQKLLFADFFLLLFIVMCSYVQAQTITNSNKPLQVFVSVGTNFINLNNINNKLINQQFSRLPSVSYNIGGGLQREVYKNFIYNSEIYVGRSLNNARSFFQTSGWNNTLGYAIINNNRNRFIPFVGFSINSVIMHSSQNNAINNFNNYLNNPPEQIALKGTASLAQVGFQCDLKERDADKTNLSIRLVYSIGSSNELHQNGSNNILSGSPTINPCGLYGRFFYFLK